MKFVSLIVILGVYRTNHALTNLWRMIFDDYCKYFVETAICRVVNTSMFSLSKTWHEGLSHGAWKSPGRAGGCINHKTTFTSNPQVHRSCILNPDQADLSQLTSTLLLWAPAVTVRIFPECFTATEFENVMFILLSLNVNFNFSSYLTSQKVKMTQCFTCFKTALGQLQEKRMIPSDSPYSKFV